MWAGSFFSTSTGHLEMSLPRCSYRMDQTRHASLVRLPFLLFLAEPFQLQKTPLFEIFMATATTCPLCCASLPFPIPPSTQRSVRRCHLPLVNFLRPVRFGRSSLSCPFSLLRQRFFRAPLVVLPSASSRFSPLIFGLLFTCYRCICSYPTHSFELFPFTTALLVLLPFTPYCFPPPYPLGSVSFSLSPHLLTASYASCLDVRWVSAACVELLTS